MQPWGAWVNTGQSSQHKRNTGLCNAAVAHVATSQCSVPASCANSAVTLRIEAAGANPLAFWRKADCREMNSHTWNEARKKKVCVCVGGWWEEKKQSKKKKRERADHKSEDVLLSSELSLLWLLCVQLDTNFSWASLLHEGLRLIQFTDLTY